MLFQAATLNLHIKSAAIKKHQFFNNL